MLDADGGVGSVQGLPPETTGPSTHGYAEGPRYEQQPSRTRSACAPIGAVPIAAHKV
jgi:hypothetical protein